MTYKREFKNSMKNLKKDKVYMQTIKDVMQALESVDICPKNCPYCKMKETEIESEMENPFGYERDYYEG